jgi:hypothetical protein
MHEPSVLFHVSEDAGIKRFDPRASASSSADAPPRPRSRQALGIPRSTDPHGSERWGRSSFPADRWSAATARIPVNGGRSCACSKGPQGLKLSRFLNSIVMASFTLFALLGLS